jgi:hypothetical protein
MHDENNKEEPIVRGEDEKEQPLPCEPGVYYVDENCKLHDAQNWQTAIDKIKWEEVTDIVQSLSKRGSFEKTVNLIGMYLLVGLVICIAGYLASIRILEGQAIAGFLGAAIGYLLSRGRIG